MFGSFSSHEAMIFSYSRNDCYEEQVFRLAAPSLFLWDETVDACVVLPFRFENLPGAILSASRMITHLQRIIIRQLVSFYLGI